MNKLLKNINQKGSTLLMVIICLAFVGILGSLMLSVSMVNYQMKKVENGSKNNFYYCEKALEEIRAGLEKDTTNTIQTEYEYVLKNYILYSILSDEDRTNKIQDEVITGFLSKAAFLNRNNNAANYADLKADMSNLFKSYLSSKDGYTITFSTNLPASPLEFKNSNTDGFYVRFINVNIVYVNADNYKTSITSDIRVTIPSFSFKAEGSTVDYSMPQQYAEYALAADGTILSENGNGSNIVKGNVYAGKGITVTDTGSLQKHSLSITGTYITTRGDILVKDTATLNIGSSSNIPLVWANNLVTDTTSYFSTITPTTLNMNAICLIKDDLTLEGRNNSVTINGAYIGYTKEQKNLAAGSSIIINGAGSNLNLFNLKTLLLAGRAHITEKDSLLGKTTSEVMTGESLAFKSNQRAYLVPGAYIKLKLNNTDPGIVANHNPITDSDLVKKDELTGNMVPLITSINVTNADLKTYLSSSTNAYLDSSIPFNSISKQTTLGITKSVLRYYYLNFASGKMADRYFADFMYKYKGNLQMMDAFPLGNVTLPATSDIYSVGNVLSYKAATADTGATLSYLPGMSSSYANDLAMDNFMAGKKFNDLDDSSVSIFDGTILKGKTISDLADLNFNLTHYLSPTKTSAIYDEADEAVTSTINFTGIDEVLAKYTTGEILNESGFTYYNSVPPTTDTKAIVVMKGNVLIPTRFNGLLITTGDVTIGEGAVINGIIIAESNITNPGSVTETITPSNVTVGKGAVVNGRIIATGNIILGEGCTIDCTHNTSFVDTSTNVSVESFLSDMFHSNGEILWKLFTNPDVNINIGSGSVSSELVNINNLVTCENWRNN